jgi:hypothetical protein
MTGNNMVLLALMALLDVLFPYSLGEIKERQKTPNSDIKQLLKPSSLLPRYTCNILDIHSQCRSMALRPNMVLYSPFYLEY